MHRAPIAVVASVLAAAVVLAQTPEALLRQSDVGVFAPPSFRARLNVQADPSKAPSQVEIWRAGEAKTLIRFLDARERGKYLLRLERDLWLLAPGARKPVRLNASHRIYGAATIDVLLGLRLSDHYRIERATNTPSAGGPLTVFDLRATENHLQFGTVIYTVRTATARPVSARYTLRSGRDATLIEFHEWSAGRRHYARLVDVTDLLRKGAVTRIEVTEFDEREVPDALFDLDDPSARRALEATPDRER